MYPLRFPPSFLTYIITFTLHTSVLVFSLLVLHIHINLSYFALYFIFPLFFVSTKFIFKKLFFWASLVAQWYRIHLPVQETQV